MRLLTIAGIISGFLNNLSSTLVEAEPVHCWQCCTGRLVQGFVTHNLVLELGLATAFIDWLPNNDARATTSINF